MENSLAKAYSKHSIKDDFKLEQSSRFVEVNDKSSYRKLLFSLGFNSEDLKKIKIMKLRTNKNI